MPDEPENLELDDSAFDRAFGRYLDKHPSPPPAPAPTSAPSPAPRNAPSTQAPASGLSLADVKQLLDDRDKAKNDDTSRTDHETRIKTLEGKTKKKRWWFSPLFD